MCHDLRLDSPEATDIAAPTGDGLQEIPFGEPRWPPVLALLVFMGLNIGLRLWLPQERLGDVPWLLPGIELLLLVAPEPHDSAPRGDCPRGFARSRGAVGDGTPDQRLDHRSEGDSSARAAPCRRRPRLARQQPRVRDALLADGQRWADHAGAAVAPDRLRLHAAASPELAPPGWRPVFLDYLHLGFTNATAFSPTDVLPLTHRAKYAMLVQSTVALALVGLSSPEPSTRLPKRRLTPTGDRSARLRSVRAAQRSA